MKVKKILLQKLVLTLYKMKKIIFLLLILLLVSCWKEKEIKKTILNINTWSKIENTIDSEKVVQIKNLLKVNKDEILILETWSNNEKTKTITQKKTNWIYPVGIWAENNTETWILSEEEINIIENTTDGEIDELIDILFKDLN